MVCIVIPCFNEAERFDPNQAEQLISRKGVDLLLVNDGSTDNTLAVFEACAAKHAERIKVLNLKLNQGKAEAVRSGMNHAIEAGAEVVGFLDGDFATSASEMLRLVDFIQSTPDVDVVLGARWLHLGADIERSQLRHYGGRVFATFASMVLNLKVYDTQCGAKLFRVSDTMQAALHERFVSNWAFDVELIGRLRTQFSEERFREVPLQQWKDVAGSKITFLDMVRATTSLLSIHRSLQRYSNSLGGHQGKNSGIS